MIKNDTKRILPYDYVNKHFPGAHAAFQLLKLSDSEEFCFWIDNDILHTDTMMLYNTDEHRVWDGKTWEIVKQ